MQPATYLDHSSRVERLVAELRSDLTRPVSLGEMGEIAAMSPFHLNRVVRELTGLPPVALHGAFRLEEAKRLLLTTDASVTDACFAVGFSSLGSFSSRFSAEVGVTPSDFKRSPSVVDGHADQLNDLIAFSSALRAPEHGVKGEVIGHGLPDGLIFVGVFPSGIARGYPVSGAVLHRPGPFVVANVPDGRWNFLVACIPTARSSIDWVLPDSEARIGSAEGIAVHGGRTPGPVLVHLRRRRPIDPPVLLSLLAAPHIVGMVRQKVDRLRANSASA